MCKYMTHKRSSIPISTLREPAETMYTKSKTTCFSESRNFINSLERIHDDVLDFLLFGFHRVCLIPFSFEISSLMPSSSILGCPTLYY
mmetsp:Transcript_18223/g.42199  ORF Transcript_18223/g.42199 Transcript_18223/m.42199 type:complete len:88 (+) Transcript_18223:856-1119(+)